MNAATIAAKLKAKGQQMTLTRTTAGVYNPVTGETTGSVTQTWPLSGITKNYSDGVKNAAGTLIQRGDQKAIIEAVAVEPKPGDSLTIRGEIWGVIAVDCLDTAGVALLYYLQVRK